MRYSGGCHCGNIEIVLESDIDPADFEVRACQCSFCRKHNSRAIADPTGHVAVHASNPTELHQYVFEFETARYLICRVCGVYVAAVTTAEPARAIVILNALDDHRRFSKEPVAAVYDTESREARIARRRSKWMPVTVTLDGVERR